MQNNNSIIQGFQQKVWDSMAYNLKTVDGKMVQEQVHTRTISPEDAFDDYIFTKVAIEQLEQKQKEIAEQPAKYEKWMAEEYPKLVESAEKDLAALKNFQAQLETTALPLYNKMFEECKEMIEKYKTENDYDNKEFLQQVEIREKSLVMVANEKKLDLRAHPIISELRAACYD